MAILAKGTLLMLATFGLAAALRGTSAAARHFVWAVGLSALIVLPFAEWSMPWRLEVLPWGGTQAVAEMHRVVESESPAAPATEGASAIRGEEAPVGPVWDGRSPERSASEWSASSAEAVGEDPSIGGFSVPGRWTWTGAILAAWAFGATLVLGRLALGVLSISWLARRARPLTSPEWYGPLGRVTERLSLRTPVRLLASDRTPMPITFGIVRPSVVLPGEAEAWDEERREVVLLHELAHVRRADLVPHLVAWVACAAWWFHPMAWMAARRLRAESEFACDDLVLRSGTRASAYAEHLLEIARGAGRAASPAFAMPMAQRRGFEGRLLTILEPDLDRGGTSRAGRAVLAAALSVVAISLAALAPAPPGDKPISAWEYRAGEASAEPDPTSASPDRIALRADRESPGEASAASEADVEVDGLRVAASGSLELGTAVRDVARELLRKDDNGEAARETVHQIARDGDDALNVVRLLAQLGVALKDVDVGVRVAAARALGAIHDPRSVEALSRALRSDPSADVRKAAAWALGEIESPAGIPALADALRRDDSMEVRKTAAWALGEIESAGAVDALGAALSDRSPEVRAMAIWALGEIESAAAVTWLEKPLREGTVEERRKAAWALGEIESAAAVDALGAALTDADPEVQAQAAWALGEIEAPQAVPWLSRALREGRPEVRRKAAWALGEIESAAAAEALIAALTDRDVEVRKIAAWAAGEIENPAAIPALRAALDDPNAEVRGSALHALMEFDDALAEDVLLDLLKSDDAKVREEAARALGKRGNR